MNVTHVAMISYVSKDAPNLMGIKAQIHVQQTPFKTDLSYISTHPVNEDVGNGLD